MAWIFHSKYNLKKKVQTDSSQETLWHKCIDCHDVSYLEDFRNAHYICSKCGFHEKLSTTDRIEMLIDTETFQETNADLIAEDVLDFFDGKEYYRNKLKLTRQKQMINDSVITGTGTLNKIPVNIAVMDFAFMGGSMGSVVGEKITRAIENATKQKTPIIIVCASGGARMQEGILSLMQMAKTSAALQRHNEAKLLYISVLTNPTTGGVTASYAMLGDFIVAEPKALIGFAGPRVISQTIKQKLPEGFQRAEFLQEHGFVDIISPRNQLKETLAKLIYFTS